MTNVLKTSDNLFQRYVRLPPIFSSFKIGIISESVHFLQTKLSLPNDEGKCQQYLHLIQMTYVVMSQHFVLM